MTVYVVGQVKSWSAEGWAIDWELGGVFSAEDKARSACVGPDDGYWPVKVDQFLGTETQAAPGAVFPHGNSC